MLNNTDSRLMRLLEILEEKIPLGENFSYNIPDLWNCFGYCKGISKESQQGILYVNPYDFYYHCICNYILKDYDPNIDYSNSLSIVQDNFKEQVNYKGGDWIKTSTIYSMHVRTSTSWDHDECGELKEENQYGLKETGTFVKSIAILPLLKKMGINAIYLLPIAQHSYKNKKGEKGSPYAVKNFFKIDEELKDPITGNDFTVADEFGAFVEACHILGIRVLIDIIPRTCARDNDLILEHPEWFYWIRLRDIPQYKPPIVPGIGENVKPSIDNLYEMYSSQDVLNLIKKFTSSPDEFNNSEWEKIKEDLSINPELNILELIEERIGLTTAPAFSDCINDPQPPWDDITFLRLYYDHPRESQKYMQDACQKPYILHDTIKCNLFKGDYPNIDLWNTLADVIPSYQRNFGIDGARVDMGHALPSELVEQIIQEPRELDKDFAFIAEELLFSGAEEAKKNGYNMIIGYGFYMEPRIEDHSAHAFIYDSRFLPLPVFAAGETADTPRLAARYGGERLSKLITVINYFMPNGVPFINSGIEIYETQPMNTGLDCAKNEQWIRLAQDDPYNGKLAFFDRYSLHWTYKNRWDMPDTLNAVSQIRNKYINTLSNLDNFIPLGIDITLPLIALGYVEEGKKGYKEDNCLMIIGNTDLANSLSTVIDLDSIRKSSWNSQLNAKILYSTHEYPKDIHDFDEKWNLKITLCPGEVKIIKM